MEQQPSSNGGPPVRRTLLELAALEKRDYHTTLQRILQADADALDVDRVSYWRLSENGATLTSELGFVRRLQAFERGITIRADQYPAYFRAIHEEHVVLADDVGQDPRTTALSTDYLEPLGISSMMDVPVWSRGRLVGVLCHEQVGAARAWTPEECDLALAVAQTIATAHEVSARQEAEELARQALFLSDATAELSLTLDVEQLPQQIAQLAVQEIADWCLLEDLDEWRQLRRLAALCRDPALQPALDELLRMRPGRPARAHFHLRVLDTGRSLLFPTVTDEVVRRFGIVDPRAREMVAELGAASAMLVPLVARGRVIAAFTLVSSSRTFGREDLRLAEDFARRAAVHLDNIRLYREAREAIHARDEFIAVASHELNTPLTSMGLAVDALKKGLLRGSPEAITRASDLVQRQQRRLARLVREMLDVTRIQSQRLILRREAVSLSDVVRDVCGTFEPLIRGGGGRLQCEIEPDVRGLWDRARIERVVENLFSNAAKFGAGKPVEVTLRRRARDGGAELRVTDHGIGIPADRQETIFERFERAVTSNEYAGLGLGLYIARGIVHAHDGEISLVSSPGSGTTFTVVLPSGHPGEEPTAPQAG